jgi:dTDP-4-dehydrorhamnose 3,5-epimerase
VEELKVVPLGKRDEPATGGIDGVVAARLDPHLDHRGSLFELVNFDHPFWQEEVGYAYVITIRPGRIKGWGMHKLQSDRYFLAHGSVRVALYDGRAGSPTHGRLDVHNLTGSTPSLLLIPPGVWHADQNWGDDDAVLLNFPTHPYNREAPDKYRIDPHSGEIPFDWTLRDG